MNTNKTQLLYVRESSSHTPISSQVRPNLSGNGHLAALQASPVKAASVPVGRGSGAAGRGTSDSDLSWPSVVTPFQLFSLLEQRWRRGRLLHSMIWAGVRAMNSPLDVRALMPVQEPRSLLSVLCFSSTHSVTVFPPLIPDLSLTPESSPWDTIFCKWTSHL